MRASPLLHQESYVVISSPSLSLSFNSLNLQSLTVPSTDSTPINLNNTANLKKPQLRKPQVSSGFVDSSRNFTVLGKNFSVSRVKVVDLRSTHLRKSQNSSGFVKSSIFEDEVGKVVKSELNLTSVGKIDEEIEEKKGKDCDVSKGKWVFDDSYPLYTNFSCPFIDEGFNCQGNGRWDKDYMKWRWQPQDCDIPRYCICNPFLQSFVGKTMLLLG